VVERTYASRDFSMLEAVIQNFMTRPEVAGNARDIAAACFAVAGPVESGATTLTNLGWRIDARELAARFRLPSVALINDFAAAGLGLPRLAAADLLALQHGLPREHGTRLVIGARTGLGAGWLTWDGTRYRAHDSEAGHADFAPLDELQDRLLVSRRRDFGRVSYERVVSGPGLMRIFSFLQETGVGTPSRGIVEAFANRADATAVIGEFGVAKRDPLAVKALDLFVSTYGAFAGNLALATLAYGGVYIAGGIEDHVHLLIELPPTSTIADTVRDIKANSSRFIHESWPELTDFAWQRRYSAFAVSKSGRDEVYRYIESQAQHHAKRSFVDELREFRERHGLPIDTDGDFD
jgi:glucokinase